MNEKIMKFFKCVFNKSSTPKSNVAVKRLKKPKKKKSKKAIAERKRKRSSYIASSFNRNFYPVEQFPQTRHSSLDMIEGFHSANIHDTYSYNLQSSRRSKSEPEIRAETAYAEYLRYYQKQILLQQEQARYLLNQTVQNTPLYHNYYDNNNNDPNAFISQQYQDFNLKQNINNNKILHQQSNHHSVPVLPIKYQQQQQQQQLSRHQSVRNLNNRNINDLSHSNVEEYHLVPTQQIPTQLLHSTTNTSSRCYPQFFAPSILSKNIFSGKSYHDKHDHHHHKRNSGKLTKVGNSFFFAE